MAGGRREARLTKLAHQTIVELLQKGNFLETALAAAGIPVATGRSWLELGAEPGSRYARFRADVLQAMAASEAAGVDLLARLGQKNPKVIQWWLERRHPGRWGLRVRHVMQQEMDDAIERIMALSDELGDEAVQRVLAALAGELGGEEAAPEKATRIH